MATLIEHREVLHAITARDAEAARRAMKTHLEAVMEELERVSDQNPEIFTPELGSSTFAAAVFASLVSDDASNLMCQTFYACGRVSLVADFKVD